MRILCAAAAYPPYGKGGGPKASETIAKALCAAGHTVRVVTVAGHESFEVRDGIEVKTLSSLNIYWNYWVENSAIAKLIWHALENFNPRALLRMRREIAAFNPDIVVTISAENINVATWLAAWSMGRPSVHAIQSYFLMCWRGSMFAYGKNCDRPCWQCRVASVGKKICSQFVDGVIAEGSHSLAAHGAQGYFKHAASKVIPGAVAAPSPSPNRAEMHDGPLRVGYIGMLTPNKGIGTLADAAALMGAEAPLHYRIAGEGKPAFVEDVLAKFPTARTTYLGWTDADTFYRSVDVLVVPSIWAEPFGYVCIEALSHGVPVIVSRAGALPEIIEPSRSGLVFEPGDAESLAACLRRLASDKDLLDRLRQGAVERAKLYAPERLAASFDAFLRQVHAEAERKRLHGRRVLAGSAAAEKCRGQTG